MCAIWVVALAVVAAWCVPGRAWLGPLVVLVVVAAAVRLLAHVVRRLGGVSGDVLGASIEVAVTATAIGFTLTS